MPTYNYQCPACGHQKEVNHSIKEEPIITCELCLDTDAHNPTVTRMGRIPCPTSFLLKGKGWFDKGGY